MTTRDKKSALIVITHPEKNSLTHALAAAVAQGIEQRGNKVTLADLVAEGFDPRFTRDDYRVSQIGGTPPADVVREQQRIERADALILVFPVYWWSFPALLKGWLDRVLTNGWAYEEGEGGQLVKKLTKLKLHMLPLAWASASIYESGGYGQAMVTQINRGIFETIGAEIVHSAPFYQEEGSDILLERAHQMGQKIFG